ncbi:MAG TPA: ABC transporter permease [Thermoanaerobaculia bacterium]|nr:ABC transporter permease [Thermoanaerobaculia bacterium]
MRRLRALLARLAGSFGGPRRERELAEELESHIRMDVEDGMRSGLGEEAARRRAVQRLGGVEPTKEAWRDRRGLPWIGELRQDLRYAARTLRRSPGFTLVTVLTLALGIGGATAIFTIVHGVLLARLPYGDADRLVAVWEENADRPGRSNVVAPANFIRWRERQGVFSEMTALYDWRVSLTGRERPVELVAQFVTSNFFTTLGVTPALGRGFLPGEGPDGNDNFVVLGYGTWQRLFGADPSIVGKTVVLSGKPSVVVGVAPRDFGFYLKAGSLVGKPPDVWLPFSFSAKAREPRGRHLTTFARLKDGVSLGQARSQMRGIAASLTAELPRFDTGWTVKLVPIREEISGEMAPALRVLSGAVAFVLLIVCVNVANLLLARGTARRQEMAIRTALGAGRSRVVRQLLTESLLLSLLGGAAGFWLARGGVALLVAISPVDATILSRVRLSVPVALFAILVSVVTAVVCGLTPAFEGTRGALADSLKEGLRSAGGGTRARRLRQALVVAEVALAAVLLVGAGLMLRSLARVTSVNPGFDAKGILTARVTLHGKQYDEDERSLAFFREAVARARAIPGVRAAGFVSFLPFAGSGAATDFAVVGEPQPAPGQEPVTDVRVCDDGYFRLMRIPLIEGRLFADRELRVRSNVVVVSEAFARKAFPKGDAIGRSVVIQMSDQPVPTRIVGIVGDVHHESLTSETRPMAYWPHPQLVYSFMTLLVATDGDPALLAAGLERAVQQVDRDQPVSEIRPMESWIADSLARSRFSSTLLAVFAALALVLAAIGIYGVMSYVVGQRRSEIGIRLALGATGDSVVRMVVGGGARLVAAGVVIGVPIALALSRTLSSLLFETSASDPATIAAAVAALGAVAVAASWVPAWRASRVAPVEALRGS